MPLAVIPNGARKLPSMRVQGKEGFLVALILEMTGSAGFSTNC